MNTKARVTILAVLLLAPLASLHAADVPTAKPNIAYILCDDLGYGDVHCLGGDRSKIATPNIDRLAAAGMTFTEAHASSAVCTPSRYGILTGRYNWRTHLQSGVLEGFSSPLIDAGRLTVQTLLKQHGYATACIGKWHLGMGISEKHLDSPIRDGPTTRGFDYYFGISASLDMPPFAFIENARFTESPTTQKKWIRKGAAAPGFEAVDVLPTLTQKAIEYIGKQAKTGKPFFLYLPLNSPHTPIVPTKAWQGKSRLGAYGDFVMETDWAVGEVLATLEKSEVAGNTLVIFTSDNGCSPAAGIPHLEKQGHYPSEHRRGYKADIWDGGHRIPFIALARSDQRRHDQRPAYLPERPDGDLREHNGREATGKCRRGQRQYPSCLVGKGGQTVTRGHRASFHQRLLCHSTRPVEARTLCRLRRVE